MKRLVLAVVAAIGAVCAQAQATVYSQTSNLSFTENDVGFFPYLTFVPNFNSSLGTLQSTTFTIVGSAAETFSFYQNLPPNSGIFLNTIQFNADEPILLSTTSITPFSFVNPTTLQDNFSVNASATYSPSYNLTSSNLDLNISIEGVLQTPACCGYTQLRFFGTLTTVYSYISVPEPISIVLLLCPLIGAVALRRRYVFTTA